MCEKRKKNKKKKTKKLSQFLKSHISGMPEAISLKFGMWRTEVGGNVHSKICLVSSRQHRATEVRKLRFLSSCQYTHGVARRLLGPHDTLPCVLIINMEICNYSFYVARYFYSLLLSVSVKMADRSCILVANVALDQKGSRILQYKEKLV